MGASNELCGGVLKNLKVKNIRIIGVIPSFAFQRAKYFTLQLHRSMPQRFPAPEIEGLLELEWNERLTEWRHIHGPEFWRLRRTVAVFLNDKFIGSDVELLKITSLDNVFLEFVPRKNLPLMKKNFREEYLARLRNTKLVYCYLDICVDDNFIGTLVFELYSNLLPKTCENFTTLCLGTKGSFFSYKGSRIHRIVKNGWLQGGDIQYITGGGGYSIYCGPLEDECYGISHNRRGVLSMANDGRHTNGSQFFITLNPCTWLDTYYVAFGQLIEGVKVLNYLESLETFKERPLKKIEIKNCGKLDLNDVDDIDARYKRETHHITTPPREPKKIEKIADQLSRLIMEAVTYRLAIKEHIPDILHEGDVPSTINLDLYFQGFYSIPEDVIEDAAKTMRNFRRELLRSLKPSATEVVEVIAYDLLAAALTKLVGLNDIREAAGHPIYKKLLYGIDMELEMVEKTHVKKFIDQLTTTAETMIKFISRKLNWMRRSVKKTRVFQEQMNDWVQSFVLQETFSNDPFRIADRPPPDKKLYTKRHSCDDEASVISITKREKKESEPYCGEEVVKKEKKKLLGKEQSPVDICCSGLEDSKEEDLMISDFFSSCRYDLRKVKRNGEEKMSILDMIEISRFHLRSLRHQENKQRTEARICLEKRINRWMKDIAYISETEWVRQTVFTKEDVCLSHTEEMMYGAMTIGLLEMYFLMEEYLKHPKNKRYRTRVIYPEDETSSSADWKIKTESSSSSKSPDETRSLDSDRTVGGGKESHKDTSNDVAAEKVRKACTCGDICCDCTSEPDFRDGAGDGGNENVDLLPRTPPPSPVTSFVDEDERTRVEETTPDGQWENERRKGFDSQCSKTDVSEKDTSCIPSFSDLDVEDLLAKVTGESPEKVDVASFKWMQEYILEKGCQFKSNFVVQVHNWLENEIFNYGGLLSKHSLVTRASLLSFSFSLASLLKEENELKSEIKNFVYDLWKLYFYEMFKEALLEYPPEKDQDEEEKKSDHDGHVPGIDKRESDGSQEQKAVEVAGPNDEPHIQPPDFDFDKFCRELNFQDKEAPGELDIYDTELEESDLSIMKQEDNVAANDSRSVIPRLNLELRGEDEPQELDYKSGSPSKTFREERLAEKIGPSKSRRSPVIIQEPIESLVEVRHMPPYILPFWVKFLTEVTKRALGLLSKISHLPRRLYFTTDSQISFEDKMKSWIEFNQFSSPKTGVKDIRDYIASQHVSLENLDDTARSFLKKKVIAELIEKSSRRNSAEILAEELILDLLATAMERIDAGESWKEKGQDTLWLDLVSAISKTSFNAGEAFDDDVSTVTDIDEVVAQQTEIMNGE